MNCRIGAYALILSPLVAACSPQPQREQDLQVIAQSHAPETLPQAYERAFGQYHASQFSSIEEVLSIRNQMRAGLESLSVLHPSHRIYRQDAQASLDRLDARMQNHEAYSTIKEGIMAWLHSDPKIVESLASSQTERGGYLRIERGRIMFDEVQRDDAHEINFRNDLETLIGKVRGQTATEAEYTQLIEKVRITEGVMLFRLSRSGISSEQERAQLERVNLGLQRMSEYLQEQYTAVFRGGIVHARFAQTEQDFLRLYTLMIIQSGINIPPADSPEKITIHTHPDFGPESVPQPSELDLGLSRGLEVSNQETGESRPAGAGFVIGFSGKGVSVYGFDFGQAELIGEFTRD